MTVLFQNDRLAVRRGPEFGSRVLLVCFDSYTDKRVLQRRAFGEDFSASKKIDAVFVISRDNDWYQYAELREALDAVRRESLKYDRTIAYGSSMGAYAAIRYGRWAGAVEAIGLSPQFSINPATCSWEKRWQFDSSRIDFILESNPDNKDGWVGNATIFFDPLDLDVKHAELVKSACQTRLVPLPGAGHPCGGFLASIDALSSTILAAIDQSLDPSELARVCRLRRRHSSHYLLNLAMKVKPRRTALKIRLVELAIQTSSSDPGVVSLAAEVLSSSGAHERAEQAHLEALTLSPGHPVYSYRYSDHLERTGRPYDAMNVLGRLDYVSPNPAYSDRFSKLYWQCFGIAEASGPSRESIDITVATTAAPPQSAVAWRRHRIQMHYLRDSRSKGYIIGDSHVEFWPAEFLPDGTFNLGVAGDRTQSVIWRINELISHNLLRPQPIILMIGANNLAMGDSARSVMAGIEAIVEKLKVTLGDVPLLVMPLPPMGIGGHFKAAERAEVNASIRKSFRSLEIENVLQKLGDAAYMGDAIHLSIEAYRAIRIPYFEDIATKEYDARRPGQSKSTARQFLKALFSRTGSV